MKRKKTILIGIICIALILGGAHFIDTYANPPIKPTGELRIAMPSLSTETFHPLWAPMNRKFYYEAIYDYLIGINEKGKFEPEESIAYKWEEAPDHLSWTFWIRDGVTFHDGTPLTLEDIKYSIYDAIYSEKCIIGTTVKPFIDWVEIVPPDKVVMHLKKPWPTLLYRFSPFSQGEGVILPKKYLKKVSASYYESHPIGTGPYKFLEKKEGNYIKFVAQDHHWRVGTPKYKYLTFKILPEAGTREAALRSGEVDLIQVGIVRANKLRADGFRIHERKGAVNIFLDFLRVYQSDNPLNKKKVRQALIYAIDKAAILKHVLMGEGNLIGHVYQLFTSAISYKKYPVTPYDPKRAKQILAEAGYPNGFTIYVYSYITTIPEQKLMNEAMAGYWEAIGMNVKIVELDFGAFCPIWTHHKEPLGPTAFLHSWTDRPTSGWRPMYHSDIKANIFSQTKDPVMDKLIEAVESVATIDEFIKAERACEERALEMFYKSGMAATNNLFVSRKDVPKWGLGTGIDCYRFEYVGATK